MPSYDVLRFSSEAIFKGCVKRPFAILQKIGLWRLIADKIDVGPHSNLSDIKENPQRFIGTNFARVKDGGTMATKERSGRYSWMKVVDVMTTDPLTVTPAESIGQADELMNANRIRQLPVVEAGELVGIITDRDIRSFLSGALVEPEAREKALNTEVREIMTTEPVTLAREDDLTEAVELLVEQKIGGIPVVDQAEGLVGIVTYIDVLRCFLNRLQEG
jgi:CBS domain-containing protein